MRIISLFAFIVVSTSLLSESYHHAGAIGIDSASHGLLYGGRVVRRYGVSGDMYRGFQERAENPNIKGPNPKVPSPDAKGLNTKVPGPNTKVPQGPNTKVPQGPNTKVPQGPNTKVPQGSNTKVPGPNTKVPPGPNTNPDIKVPDDEVVKGKDPTPPPVQAPAPAPTPKTKNPKIQGPPPSNTAGTDDTTDTTLTQDDGQDPNTQSEGQAGTPTVATGSMSSQAIGGLAAVGGVFVLVGGLFAFSQRRKNKEMTKSIVSNSAKAWEQQNSAYEIMEEETKPIGSYIVIATYTPTLADELDIQPGDTVTILVEYDDGWVQGINETRGGTKGVFPRHCVDMSHTPNKTKNNKRSSSMGGYTEGYTEVDLS